MADGRPACHRFFSKEGRRSSTLQDIWAPSLKKQAEIAEERFFYQCNIAFHASRTGAYKRFVNAISAAAAAGAPITPAGSEALRTTRLARQVDMVHGMLEGHRESWAVYGCTIISDGWKDVRKRHLLNILVSCCTGTTFLRAIDMSGAGIRITGELIFNHIRAAIEEIGPANVVQVVTDNASNCKLMGEMVEAAYPHIVWSPCAAHTIDLMMEDIGDLPWVSALVDKALQLINFIRRKSFALGLFTAHCKWVLKKPTKTRVDAMLDIFDTRWIWFRRPIHCVAHILHPAWRSDAQRSDCVLLTGWNTYVERIHKDNGHVQNRLEEDLLEYRGGRGNFSRVIAKNAENQALQVSWWEKFGGLNPTLQTLALRVLSQEVSSSGAERLWSIMGDIHTKDRNR
ncbi:hypothetical protein L7F22_041345 [Adiantum nelumboides]|nr:hypothetical protein [Adiantum nelumboides]